MPLAAAIPLIQAGIGGLQSLFSAGKARKTQKQLEGLQSPTYAPNQSIMDFYNNALSRYQTSPTDSALYKRQSRNIFRNTASGLNRLQDTRGAIGGTSSLIRAQNDAMLDAEAAAEQQQNQRFGQLGEAAGMKAGEEQTAFNVNKMGPFERKYNLLAAKAGAANQGVNAGITNMFGGLSNLSNYFTTRDYIKSMNK